MGLELDEKLLERGRPKSCVAVGQTGTDDGIGLLRRQIERRFQPGLQFQRVFDLGQLSHHLDASFGREREPALPKPRFGREFGGNLVAL